MMKKINESMICFPFDESRECVYKAGWSDVYPMLSDSGFIRPEMVTVVYSNDSLARKTLAMDLVTKVLFGNCLANGAMVFSTVASDREYCSQVAMMMSDLTWKGGAHGAMCWKGLGAPQYIFDKSAAKLSTTNLYIEDNSCIEPDALVESVQALPPEVCLGLVVVDSLQGLKCGSVRDAVGWGVIGSRLKTIASQWCVPVLVLSGVASEEVRKPDVFNGYGCLSEYVDIPLALTRYENDSLGNRKYKLHRVDMDETDDSLIVRMTPDCQRVMDISYDGGTDLECLPF